MKLFVFLAFFSAYCAQANCIANKDEMIPTKNSAKTTQLICTGFSHDDLKKVEVFETDLTAQYVVIETDCNGNSFFHQVINGNYMPNNTIQLFDYRGRNEMFLGPREIVKKAGYNGAIQFKIEYNSYDDPTLFMSEPIYCVQYN